MECKQLHNIFLPGGSYHRLVGYGHTRHQQYHHQQSAKFTPLDMSLRHGSMPPMWQLKGTPVVLVWLGEKAAAVLLEL